MSKKSHREFGVPGNVILQKSPGYVTHKNRDNIVFDRKLKKHQVIGSHYIDFFIVAKLILDDCIVMNSCYNEARRTSLWHSLHGVDEDSSNKDCSK